MDILERFNDPPSSIRSALLEWQKTQFHILPGVLNTVQLAPINNDSQHPLTGTATVGLQYSVQIQDGVWEWRDYPPIGVVIIMPGSTDQFLIHNPPQPQCKGTIFVSTRCIQGFMAGGGNPFVAQPAPYFHMNDLTESFFMPGTFPFGEAPGVKAGEAPLSLTNLQIRLKDGSAMIEMTPEGLISMTPKPGQVVRVNGNLEVTENITWKAGTADATDAFGHTHPTPAGQSGPPTPGT